MDQKIYFMLGLTLEDAVDHHGLVQGEAEPWQVGHEEHGHSADEDGGGRETETSLSDGGLKVWQHSLQCVVCGALHQSPSALLQLDPDDVVEGGEEEEGEEGGGSGPGQGGVPEDVVLAQPQLGGAGEVDLVVPAAAAGEVHAVGVDLGLEEPGQVEEDGKEDGGQDVAERPHGRSCDNPALNLDLSKCPTIVSCSFRHHLNIGLVSDRYRSQETATTKKMEQLRVNLKHVVSE